MREQLVARPCSQPPLALGHEANMEAPDAAGRDDPHEPIGAAMDRHRVPARVDDLPARALAAARSEDATRDLARDDELRADLVLARAEVQEARAREREPAAAAPERAHADAPHAGLDRRQLEARAL